MNDTTPYTLKFEIPNGPEEKTTVFNRIVLTKPGKGKKPGDVLMLPNFPTDAPGLDQKILDMADKPAIVQGLVEIDPEIAEDIKNSHKKGDKAATKHKKTEEEPEEVSSEEKPSKADKEAAK